MATAYYRLGRMQEALQIFELLLKNTPNDANLIAKRDACLRGTASPRPEEKK